MTKKKTTKKSKKTFEDHLRRLEEIVEELENGELPLETSIERYEAGMGALKECYAILNEAEKKIETIAKSKSAPKKKKKVDVIDTNGDLLAADEGDDDESVLF